MPALEKRAAREREIIGAVAEILATAEPSRFRFEALCRHTLRANRCLQGTPWQRADDWAAQIVAAALVAIGAERPTWKQGQPEYTQEWYSPIERLFCVRCGKRLPAEHLITRRYCSRLCGDADASARRLMHETEDARAKRLTYLAMWRRRNGEA